MACRPAPACTALLTQATVLWPKRLRASDGICASPRHTQQNPTSDHEFGNAVDLTHDPANGCDAHAVAELIKASKDERVRYVISNQRIWNPSISDAWRPYKGSNPHSKHIHVSIYPDARGDVRPWPLTPLQEDDDMPWTDLDSENLAAVRIAMDRIAHEIAGPSSIDGKPTNARLPRLLRAVEAIKTKLGA